MALEIERKYLVADPGIVAGLTGVRMAQGYIADNGMWVRVRIAGDTGFLTLKGPARGMSRAEFEYRIPLADSETLLADRKSTRLNSSHLVISYAVFCLKKKKNRM